MKRKQILTIIIALVMVVSFVACTQPDPQPQGQAPAGQQATPPAANQPPAAEQPDDWPYRLEPGGRVGVALTSREFQRWVMCGDNLSAHLEARGFVPDLQYGEGDAAAQIAQIENMIATGVGAIIVAPVDSGALTDVLARAREAGVFILNYDIVVMNSPDVSFFVGYDNWEVGRMQGRYIEEKLGLAEGNGPFNIEVFAGGLDEAVAYFLFEEAMGVLQPYFDSGQLVVPSGQTDVYTVTIRGWSGALALERMENLLMAHYADGTELHAVLTPSDAIGVPVAQALVNDGFGTADRPFPVVTANDSTIGAIQSIINGHLTMSVFKDTRYLAERAVDIIETVANGSMPIPNNTTDFDNGAIIVPAIAVPSYVVDLSNWEELILGTDFFTREQLGLN